MSATSVDASADKTDVESGLLLSVEQIQEARDRDAEAQSDGPGGDGGGSGGHSDASPE